MPSDYVVFKRQPGTSKVTAGSSAGGQAAERDGTPESWVEIGRASAATPKSAIKQVTDGKPAAERTGTFVGVPVRSFQPVTRRVEAAEKEIWE